ncbi:MAG: threonine synthase [Roseiflexaceae bacterium]|nr:threonine synthase [Roseiflexaceae bacterium]
MAISTSSTESISSAMIDLECGMCGTHYSAEQLINLCPMCGKPLLVRYDLARAARTLTREALRMRQPNMWRYQELLPVRDPASIINLGEGWTPLIAATRLGQRIGCAATYIKDESLNPTGSFKARGQAAAISRARELGATAIAIPSAGNAAGAMSAYAAAAGLPAHVFMPADVPLAFRAECAALGAHVTLVDGLINDCGVRVREGAALHGWFDVSTLREPYRIEGKKTMGYELAEQLDWRLPDVLIYPTGGGTGLIGMWKAFDELETMGLIGPKRPRLVCVQAAGCAPIVQAYANGQEHAPLWQGAKTIADGLRVPIAIGDFLIIRALRASNGTALTVSDQEMLTYTNMLGATTGIFAAPEGGACLAAQVKLLESGWIAPDEQVVLLNTGSGLKYAHLWA